MESKDQLPLRIGVGVVLLNSNNHVFVGKRIDNPKKFWQMPQGGIEKNENTLNAAKRELEEETGVTSIKLIKELDEWLIYNLPKNLLGKIWKGRYRGQKQKWFVMRFLGNEKEINIKTKHPEFIEWKWIELDEITEVVVDFKLNIYKKVKEKVKEIIN
jgi:putative (di)nucleoside polyphosphate hydrolase